MAEVLVKELPNRFKEAIKLVALFQLTLEQMDMFKGSKLYKHGIKNKINSLEKDIEYLINKPVAQLDKTDFTLFQDIQLNIDAVLDLSIDELSQLRIVVDNSRARNTDPHNDKP